MSKKTLVLIAATLLVIAVATWRAGSYPAQLLVVNQSGRPLADVLIECGDQRELLGILRNGETRIVRLAPGAPVAVSWRGGERWQSKEDLRPARTSELFIAADRIELQLASRRGAD